jgi:tryptophanyl-tRNA synthetase
MSKSYGNTIDIFMGEKALKKCTGKIVTQSVPLEDPKEYKDCNVYELCKLFMDNDELKELQDRYQRGGEGHGHFKMTLKDKIWDYFSQAREKREYYLNHKDEVMDILDEGAKKARVLAQEKMQIVRESVGIYR